MWQCHWRIESYLKNRMEIDIRALAANKPRKNCQVLKPLGDIQSVPLQRQLLVRACPIGILE